VLVKRRDQHEVRRDGERDPDAELLRCFCEISESRSVTGSYPALLLKRSHSRRVVGSLQSIRAELSASVGTDLETAFDDMMATLPPTGLGARNAHVTAEYLCQGDFATGIGFPIPTCP
jgi:hypothetical protein